ncbi:MAG: sigma-70 family RNA polymerase sigma factor [Oscillospiraceae bacterium]|nr:sigma-70 family RNA polymerase sigma factor [Oscillospiraceae bacterium]
MLRKIEELYDKIYRYCFYRLRNSASAEDITQEAFLRYFAQNTDINAAYIFTIAKNLCTDMFRRKQTEELSDDYPTEDFSDKSDTKVEVRTALENLGEQHREVLVMRYIADMSVNETAETLGISRFAVYRLEKAALAQMKKLLKGALK